MIVFLDIDTGKVPSAKRSIKWSYSSAEAGCTWRHERSVWCWGGQAPWMARTYVSESSGKLLNAPSNIKTLCRQPYLHEVVGLWSLVTLLLWQLKQSLLYRCLIEYIPTLQLTLQQQVCQFLFLPMYILLVMWVVFDALSVPIQIDDPIIEVFGIVDTDEQCFELTSCDLYVAGTRCTCINWASEKFYGGFVSLLWTTSWGWFGM